MRYPVDIGGGYGSNKEWVGEGKADLSQPVAFGMPPRRCVRTGPRVLVKQTPVQNLQIREKKGTSALWNAGKLATSLLNALQL